MSIANNIALLRKEAGLTQEQLAEKCDVSRQAVTKWEAGISEPSIDKLVNLAEVFQVTIDELINGNKNDKSGQSGIDIEKIRFVDVAMCIAGYSGCFDLHSEDYLLLESYILNHLGLLYGFMSYKYVSPEGKVYEKYLLKNTTKEERKKFVSLINRYDAIDDYVNGKCEIDEALDKTVDEISKDASQIHNVEIKKKEESKEGKLYGDLKDALKYIKFCSVLSDKVKEKQECKLRQSLEQLHLDVKEYGDDTVLGKIWSILEQEVEDTYKSEDMEKIDNLVKVVDALKNFVWTLIPVEEEQNRRKKYIERMERRLNL